MTMATTVRADGSDCQWCGEAPWELRCTKCDPRKEKRLCMECAKRWHSRGFSRHHPLEDRMGTTLSFAEWLARLLRDAAASSMTNGSNGGATIGIGVASSALPAEGSGGAGEQTVQKHSVADETPVSRENSGSADTDAADIEFGHGGDEDDVQVANGPEVPQEIPAQLSEETQLDLEDALNRLPSDDRAILDALADHIHDMIRLEDAVLCQQFTKCEAPTCQSILAHQRHVIDRTVCAIPTCQSIASYMAHMEFCNSRKCPFCVRVHQRRHLGKRQALDFLIRNQRRQLEALRREGGDQARENFMQDQIRAFERKQDRATEEIESLNRIVVTERLPIFNFPRFSWHIIQEPVIKEEPTQTEEIPPIPQLDSTVSSDPTETEEKHADEQDRAPDTGAGGASQEDPHSNTTMQDDFVSGLLVKKASGDATAKALLEESVQHAFKIVDASFCSPSKAARCLLNCHKILLHLQHHVDLRVCKDKMCDTVEQHFSHLSKCQNEGTDAVCEYCMRVSEREFARAAEVMEAEQPETDLKIQRLITGITESLANDPHDEREQNVMQLEDELQQAEDYKKALSHKIDTARMNLVKSRRRMKRHPANPPASHVTGLPLHWIKAARATSPSSLSSKRRRA